MGIWQSTSISDYIVPFCVQGNAMATGLSDYTAYQTTWLHTRKCHGNWPIRLHCPPDHSAAYKEMPWQLAYQITLPTRPFGCIQGNAMATGKECIVQILLYVQLQSPTTLTTVATMYLLLCLYEKEPTMVAIADCIAVAVINMHNLTQEVWHFCSLFTIEAMPC